MVDVATVAVAVLLAAVVARAVAKRTARARRSGSSEIVMCDVCGLTYPTREEARDHARDAHNAPGSDADVDELLVARSVDG